MTEIDPKALEHACLCAGRAVHHFDRMALDLPLRASITAHARAIEQHEAFKREVSDALSVYQKADGVEERSLAWDALDRFIIAKPDPLVEAIRQTFPVSLAEVDEGNARDLRAALASRGLKIVEVGHD